MNRIFLSILNMSLTGSVVIGVVLLARLFLKRAPKIYSYALWAVVLFRLLCPLSITAGLSVLKPIPVTTTPGISTVVYPPIQEAYRFDRVVAAVQPEPKPTPVEEQMDEAPSPMEIAAYIWLGGAAMMAAYSAAQYLILRRRLREAAPILDGVYLVDSVSTPFVMGVLHPRIYLPSAAPEKERPFILAHERHHIRRLDPLWKLLGYLALCLHWFNPLAWLAFSLAGKDMEMSCDEAVLRRLGEGVRADYAQALLRLATPKRALPGMPLAFGEGDTRGRVRNMARWKRPRVWVSVLCAVLCIGILAACALNPKQEEKPLEELTQITGPAGIGAWDLYFTLPEGCTHELREKGDGDWTDTREGCVHILTDGTNTIGGIMAFPIPDNFGSDGFDWLRALDFPEWQDDTLGYYADRTGDGRASISFFSDVPDGQERTVNHSHNLYVWDGWIYDLWFDDLTVTLSVKTAILNSVSLGQPQSTAPFPMPYRIGKLPDGFAYETASDGSVEILHAGTVVGGITAYAIPAGVYDPNDDVFLWLEDVGIPDLEDDTLMELGGISGFSGGWKMTVADDVQSPKVQRTHRFQVAGDVVYDFWLDDLALDLNTQFLLEDALTFDASAAQQTGRPEKTELSFVVEGAEEKLPATLYAGNGYSLDIPDDGWTYFRDTMDGQSCDIWESIVNPDVRLGVIRLEGKTEQEASVWIQARFEGFDLIEDRQGGLGGTNSENLMADVRLVPWEEAVYAVCRLYPLEAAEGFGTRLEVMADSFALTGMVVSEEDYAFSKAQAVMDGLQDGGVHIRTQCRYQNNPGENYTEDFYFSENLGFLKVTNTAGGQILGELYADERYFVGEGTEGALVWREQEPESEFLGPWLGSFYFVKHNVTYLETGQDGGGENFFFRIDKALLENDPADSFYFATFYFDKEGAFRNVSLYVNPDKDKPYTLTESIVTTDQKTVEGAIQDEFSRAAK